MILDFESWLREASHVGDSRIRRQATLRDVQGSIDVFEIYAGQSMKGFVIEAARAYLADRSIREILVDRNTALPELLAGHRGEVWITGAVHSHPIQGETVA